jgi:F-type H+-transporting ATPase subunit delta
MEDITTIARPYATAVFDQAREEDNLGLWSEMLAFLASVSADPQLAGIISDPRIDKDKKTALMLDICGGRLSRTGENFLKVLVANGRLGVVGEIARIFDELRAEAEERIEVQVTSAYALNAKLEKEIADAMRKRLGREVNVTTEIDRSIMAGVVIRAGDLVIDASVRGRLQQLAAELTA